MTRGLICISSKLPGWMKTSTCSGSRAHYNIPGIGNDQEDKVLLCFQKSQTFHKICRNQINATVYLLPENHTDKIQPIDAGCGQMMKVEIGAAMETWLEEEKNLGRIEFQQR